MENETNKFDPATSMAKIIRDNAMLARVSVRMWTGEILDRRAARAAAEAEGASGPEAFKVRKNLLYKHDTRLRKIRQAGAALRTAHGLLTMPWGERGIRMLPTAAFLAYSREIGKFKSEFEEAVKDFLANYPTDAAKARVELNIAEDSPERRLYPSAETLSKHFSAEVQFEPIPAGRAFRNLPEAVATKLAQVHEERLSRKYREGMLKSLAELRGMVSHAIEVLRAEPEQDKAQKWRNSTFWRPAEAAKCLSSFDVFGREDVREVCGVITGYFSKWTEKNLAALRSWEQRERRPAVIDDITVMFVKLDTLVSELADEWGLDVAEINNEADEQVKADD